MKIEICDICKEIPKQNMSVVHLIRFESEYDWFGRPKEEKTICRKCLDKIFPPKNTITNLNI